MNGNLTILTTQQVMVMVLLILTGFVAAKVGAVKPQARFALSDMLVNIVVPAMIIDSYIMVFDPTITANLVRTLVASTVALLSGVIVSALVCRWNKSPDMPIVRFAMAAGNSGYMGFPLIKALFGSVGLLYASIFLTVYNILVWTIGARSLNKEKSGGALQVLKDLAKTPALAAVVIGIAIYLIQIPVPDIIHQPIELLGNLNTPLSMFVTGMLIADGGILLAARNRELWVTTVVRLLFIPAIALLLCRIMGISGIVRAVVVLLSGCPCASMTSVFAVRYHYDEGPAAGLVAISTLLSIITLPVFASFL